MPSPPAPPAAAEPEKHTAAEAVDPALAAKTKEQEALAIDNKLEAERLIAATNAMRAEVEKMKIEREFITEKLALETTKRQVALQADLAKMTEENERLATEGELSKSRAEKLANDLKAIQAEAALETV